jgi:hypothetical protein
MMHIYIYSRMSFQPLGLITLSYMQARSLLTNQALGSGGTRLVPFQLLQRVPRGCSPQPLSAASRELHKTFQVVCGGACLPPCVIDEWFGKRFLLQPNNRSCVLPDETLIILSILLLSLSRRASKRRVQSLQLLRRSIPQFALYSLSLGIGATIARLSADRGIALVGKAYASTSRSSSTAVRGASNNSTSFWRCSSLRTSADPWIIGRESAGRHGLLGTNRAVLRAVNLPSEELWTSRPRPWRLGYFLLLGWSLIRFGLIPSLHSCL